MPPEGSGCPSALDVLVVWCPSGQFCSGLSDSQLAKVDVDDPTKQKIFKFENTDKLLFPAGEEALAILQNRDVPNDVFKGGRLHRGPFKGDFKGKQSKPL